MNLIKLLLGFKPLGDAVFYICGADVLPPPLKGEEENAALEQLEEGSESAKQLLIEHNLRLVVFIARRFENTGIQRDFVAQLVQEVYAAGGIPFVKVDDYRRLEEYLIRHGLL